MKNEQKEKKLRLFARLWGMGYQLKAIYRRIRDAKYPVTESWVKAKAARLRHF